MTSQNNRWADVVPMAARFRSVSHFDEEERDYKLQVAQAFAEARNAFLMDATWQDSFKSALMHPKNNLVGWRVRGNLWKFVEEDPDGSHAALAAAWEGSTIEDAVAAFLRLLPSERISGEGTRLSVSSLLLLAVNATDTALYRPTPVANIRRILNWEVPDGLSEAGVYSDYLVMLDEFMVASAELGLELRDRLDAQSVLYSLAQWDPPADFTTDERLQVIALRGSNMSSYASLTKHLEDWDPSEVEARVQQGQSERREILDRFPLKRWPELELANYALGLENKDVYSKWIEFGSTNVGSIKGGSSRKHLVYKRAHRPGWYHEERYADAPEAWEAVRAGFVQLLQLCAQGDFDEIDEIEALEGASAVRTKTAFVYFPDELLPIYSSKHLDYWLSVFGVSVPSDLGPAGKNRRLLAELKTIPELEGWSSLEMMFMLYAWSPPDLNRSIVKVEPGEDGALWDECVSQSCIRIGYEALGDLAPYEDLADIEEAFTERFPEIGATARRNLCRGLKRFSELQFGDVVIANRGTDHVLGLGQVTDGYTFRNELPTHQHTVEVDWFDTAERQVDFGKAWLAPIVKVSPEDYHGILHEGVPAPAAPTIASLPPVPSLYREAERMLERQGQIVLYGPPGTGKTYSARRLAVWQLLGGSSSPEAAHAFGADFSAHEAALSTVSVSDERPSWVLVANPSRWRWQQLIEDGSIDYDYGRLQRNYAEVLPGDEVFGYESTPTKRIVAKAVVTKGHAESDGPGITVGNGELIEGGPTWDQLQEDPLLSQAEPLVGRMQGTLFRLEPNEAAHLRAICGGVESSAVRSAIPQLTRVTFHPTYSYEDFIEGYKPVEAGRGGLELQMRPGLFKQVCRAASADPQRPYVVLIDEINRGNVPKIFGELITLIEKDKRGMTASLPQSGEPFHVPPNVSIIATMNTADRSIQVLDAALRRRFAFQELLPDPSVLENAYVGPMALEHFLEGINALVRQHIGREKQIGHALVMNGDAPIKKLEDFALAFRYELLPLLQEYTYGDYSDLALLVGEEVIDVDEQIPRAEILEDPGRLVRALATHLEIGQ